MSDQAARLDRWKQSLLDPKDRLVDLGGAGIHMDIDPMRIAFSLAAGSMLALEAADAPGFENGRVRIAVAPAELERQLALLRRDVRAARAEADHVLWLGLGLVTWPDESGTQRTAPLACWPVELVTGLDGGPRLRSAEDLQPRANHMLLEALQRIHDVTLDMGGELDLGMLFDAAGSAVGWRLDRVACLVTCSFARFDMWRDLDDRADLASAMPVGWMTGELGAAPLPSAPIADLLTPLDADASQLAVVAIAGAGGSFVVQGAPGTGKSQTIANLAVHCAAQGKRVLVVSDRATALDTIQQRLTSVGFGELCLPLYAGRERVLETLATIFGRTHRPVSGTSSAEARLGELRSALDNYVTALHRIGALGQSIHEVLGRLVELRTAPRAPLSERDAAVIDRGTFARRRTAVVGLAEAARTVEPIAAHPWRTSALESWHADGTERATRALNDVASAVETLQSAIADVAALVPGIVTRTPEQLRAIGVLADLAAASPRPGSELLTNMRGKHDDIGERVALIRARGAGALDVPRDPGSFLAIAVRHRALATEVAALFTSVIDELESPADVLAQLKKWTASMAAFRYVALRNARATVKAAAQPGTLETDEAMIGALEAVIAERACREALIAAAEPARRWFGDMGGDALALDVAKIEEAVAWGVELRKAFDVLTIGGGEPGKQAAWRSLVAQVAASPQDGERPAVELAPFSRLAAAVSRWEPALVELAAASGIPQLLLGAGSDHLAGLAEQVSVLRQSVGTLADWTRFNLARRDAVVAGIGPAIGAIERGDLTSDELADTWERATLLAWFELEVAETPALARFVGATHHTYATSFADLDRGALAVTRARIVSRLAERMQRSKELDPELAVLKEEIETTKPRALRTLLAALPMLLPRLSPVVLATPHAVAAHLDGSHAPFDLVVFDESSHLPMSHALGALARGLAVVIVGDARQLAPAEEDGLLEAARAAQLPNLTLGAHYRSRHEDLFAFAGSRYYEDRIEVLPAPYRGPDLGVTFRFFEVGDVEAIVSELRTRLADTSRVRSFAIVTLTRDQQDCVEHMLEAAAVTEPAIAAALSAAREPLVVGTPERLVGEERDVVYFMLGDASGRVDNRALTVATTRAREQLVITASTETFTGDLADLVAFARLGGGAGKPADDVPPASPITAAIARALTDRGWIVKHQVGCGAYKLDLAVVDPTDPERYVLAIEHDGPSYAQAPSARTRDRLRTQLLVSLGWRVHRIWSLDWWHDAEREVQRAHGAIVAAIAASRQRRTTVPPTMRASRPRATMPPRGTPRITTPPVVTAASAITTPTIVPTTKVAPKLADDTMPTVTAADPGSGGLLAAGSGPTDAVSLIASLPEGSGPITPLRLPRGAIAIGPYMAAAVPAGRRAPDDMFAARYQAELGKCIEQVLSAEAPIHLDLLARRVGAYFGVGKISPPVVAAVKAALAGRGKVGEESGIVWRVDQDPTSVPAVRVAGQGPTARRDISEVPLAELAAAVRIVVERANGLAATDLVRDCARLLGFARLTDQVSARVSLGIQIATVRQLISIDGGKAHLMLE